MSSLQLARYLDGEVPDTCLKVRLNVPREANPTAKQISVTLAWVLRSISLARSIRRLCRYLWGVSAEGDSESPHEVSRR